MRAQASLSVAPEGEERYYVVHPHAGLLVQGDGRVVAGPWIDADEPGQEPASLADDVSRFATLDEAVAEIRSLS